MLEVIVEMFSYPFMVRAFCVGAMVSLCASLLGVCLVLKRYAMIGDGLSHVGFGAMAIAAALNVAPLAVAIPVVIVAAFLLLRVSENSKIKGDAAVALVSSAALAIGVLILSFSGGKNYELSNYMFGSILSLSDSDTFLSAILSAAVLSVFIIFYNRIFAVTFDETFAKATGINSGAYNMLLAFLTAITIVLGMRMMGALLISSLILFPALSAMRVCKHFQTVVLAAGIISITCFAIGMILSYALESPTGASVVAVNVVAFSVMSLIGKIRYS